MLYDYECTECGETIRDVKQSIHEEAWTKCPTCKNESLQRIPHGGLGAFMKHSSNTIGGQADKNWSNMGHYQKSEIEAQNKAKSEQNNKRNQHKEINKMTAKQKERYIRTGEK